MAGVGLRVRHGARRRWGDVVDRRLREPSFLYKVEETRRVRRLMRGLGTKDPAFLVDAKDDGQAWARAMGFRTPAPIGVVQDIRQVGWDTLPEALVLKPVRGTTGAGVSLLRRHGDRWRELSSDRLVSADELVADYDRLERAGRVSSEVLLEELVLDPRNPEMPSADYKVTVFYGKVGFVEAKRRRPIDGRWRTCWRVFDPQWRPLRNPFNDYWVDDSIEPPVHRRELLDLASRVSLSVPRPYLRVDLLEDTLGPVLGEVTPEPGGVYHAPRALDRLLGAQWEAAESRLRVRAARAGFLTPDGVTHEETALDVRRAGPLPS